MYLPTLKHREHREEIHGIISLAHFFRTDLKDHDSAIGGNKVKFWQLAHGHHLGIYFLKQSMY